MLGKNKSKFQISNLYFAKCRHCIMDIINSYSIAGEEIIPRPDYIDYFTILMKNDDGSFIDIFNPNTPLSVSFDCENIEENYDSNIIFTYKPLSQYIKCYDKLNYRECLIALEIIKKAEKLKDSYGYKHSTKRKKLTEQY